MPDPKAISAEAKLLNERARASMPDLLRGSRALREIWIGMFRVQANVHFANLQQWYNGLGLQCPFKSLEDIPADDWKLIASAARNNLNHLVVEHTEYTDAREAILARKAEKKRRKAS